MNPSTTGIQNNRKIIARLETNGRHDVAHRDTKPTARCVASQGFPRGVKKAPLNLDWSRPISNLELSEAGSAGRTRQHGMQHLCQ
jgi:hypothetical protein